MFTRIPLKLEGTALFPVPSPSPYAGRPRVLRQVIAQDRLSLRSREPELLVASTAEELERSHGTRKQSAAARCYGEAVVRTGVAQRSQYIESAILTAMRLPNHAAAVLLAHLAKARWGEAADLADLRFQKMLDVIEAMPSTLQAKPAAMLMHRLDELPPHRRGRMQRRFDRMAAQIPPASLAPLATAFILRASSRVVANNGAISDLQRLAMQASQLPRPVRASALHAAFVRLASMPAAERPQHFTQWLGALAKTPTDTAHLHALSAAAHALVELDISNRSSASAAVLGLIRRLPRSKRAQPLAALVSTIGALPPGSRGPHLQATLETIEALPAAIRTAPLHAAIDATMDIPVGIRSMFCERILDAASLDAPVHLAVLERALHRLAALEIRAEEHAALFDLAAARVAKLPPNEDLSAALVYAAAELPPSYMPPRAGAAFAVITTLPSGKRYAALAAAPSLLRLMPPGVQRDRAFATTLAACVDDPSAGSSLAALARELALLSPRAARTAISRFVAILRDIPLAQRREPVRILLAKLHAIESHERSIASAQLATAIEETA